MDRQSGVEDLFAQPRSGHCRHGFVRGPDHWLQTAVWLCDSAASSQIDLVVRHPIVEVDGKGVLKDRQVLV